ncbi:MAG TPA: GspH/FimT family pseudopilin [Phycisphaerae bacterium]|jgi:type II secretory pathway pseudopilin PulG
MRSVRAIERSHPGCATVTGVHAAGARRTALTLLELLLVIGLLTILAGLVFPNMLGLIERERLPQSAEQVRSLLQMTRANAMFDGRRYRIRFTDPQRSEHTDEARQPIIEREDDPLENPEKFNPVGYPWARGVTLHEQVWCAQVLPGKPYLDEGQVAYDAPPVPPNTVDREKSDPLRPAIYFDPNGMSSWATFRITTAPLGTEPADLKDKPVIDVIFDGETGLAWLQRPFYPEEIDMLTKHDWPPVLRSDFLRPQPLTEDEVLEIRETLVRKK